MMDETAQHDFDFAAEIWCLNYNEKSSFEQEKSDNSSVFRCFESRRCHCKQTFPALTCTARNKLIKQNTIYIFWSGLTPCLYEQGVKPDQNFVQVIQVLLWNYTANGIVKNARALNIFSYAVRRQASSARLMQSPSCVCACVCVCALLQDLAVVPMLPPPPRYIWSHPGLYCWTPGDRGACGEVYQWCHARSPPLLLDILVPGSTTQGVTRAVHEQG